MEPWIVAIIAMSAYLAFAFALGLLAGRGRSFFSVSEYAVADRGLGFFVMWFLMGGAIFCFRVSWWAGLGLFEGSCLLLYFGVCGSRTATLVRDRSEGGSAGCSA